MSDIFSDSAGPGEEVEISGQNAIRRTSTSIGIGPRSGSGAKRSQIIKEKQALAIASGEKIEFCGNCGEIETVTWRKCWFREYEGDMAGEPQGPLSMDPGGIRCYKKEAEDAEGKVTRYRIYKKAPSVQDIQDKTMSEMVLCNRKS